MASHSSAPASRLQRLLFALTNWGLFFAGLLNLGIGTRSALSGDVAIAATSLTAGLVLLFAATIDRFESLKGLGVEAKTRQLDQKIEQADDALRRLRELTELAGASLVDINSKMGRWDSAPSPRDTYALAQKVRSIMSGLGSDEGTIRNALNPWVRSMCMDVTAALIAPLWTAVQDKVNAVQRQVEAYPQPIKAGDPEHARLVATMREGSAFIERLKTFRKLQIDEYPDRMLEFFEAVPLLSADEAASLRSRALKFSSGMREIRQQLQLTDPEAWLAEIEQHRKKG
jgi:hypothetical protein